MDRIQKLDERLKKIEALHPAGQPHGIWSTPEVTYSYDKPKLAGAIVLAAVVALFISGFFLGWGWGWETAIGVCGAFGLLAMVAP